LSCHGASKQTWKGRSSASASAFASPTSVAIVIIIVVALAVDMAQARPPFAAPTQPDGGKDIPDDVTRTVTFRHAGYPDEHNIIMVLPALDDAQGGIHHETALIACAVVAGNRWDGFLSEDRTGSGILTPRDGVLRGKEYYFRLPGDERGRSSTQQRLNPTQLTQTQSDGKVSTRPSFHPLALFAQQAAARLVANQSTEHAGRPCVASPGQPD
jgi:hypothetical protein